MTWFLSNVAREIASCIDWTTLAVGGIFHVITSTGALILRSIVFTLTTLWTFSLNLFDGVAVFLHDFALFLADINDLSEELLRFFNTSADHIAQTAFKIMLGLHQSLVGIHQTFCAASEGVFTLVVSALLGVKSLFILVGDGTLFLLQLGPNAVVSLFVGTFSAASWIVHILWYYLTCFTWGVATIFTGLHYELTDIPASSLLGVLLALIIAVTTRFYFKSINWTAFWQKIKAIIGEWMRRRRRLRTTADLRLNESGSSVDGEDPTPSSTNKRLDPVQQSKNYLLRQLEIEREDKLCVICQDRNKCVILLPCRHYALCEICIMQLLVENPFCPICRQFVRDNLKIYG